MDTILLYSGGLDSLVSLGRLLESDPKRRILCLFFDYDQYTVNAEWTATEECLSRLPGELNGLGRVELRQERLLDYKKFVDHVSVVGGGHIPTAQEDPMGFFVPGRNILFLLYAAIIGYPHQCRDIAFSPHQWSYAGDSLPEFIVAQTEAFAWGFTMDRKPLPYRIWSPIADVGKDGVVREGVRMGLPMEYSWSCHDAQRWQCGVCHNCEERKKAFAQAGVPDQTIYLA